MIGIGRIEPALSGDEMRGIVAQAVASAGFDGKRVLVIIPDGTRTMPMPQMFALLQELLRPRVAALDYLVALGTHPVMNDAQLSKLVGQAVVNGIVQEKPQSKPQGELGSTHVFNHRWDNPATFVTLGEIPAAEVSAITGGRLQQAVPVSLNKLILDYDHIIICGPVFPHEVVGFSGGNKYFYPGIAGAEIINLTHWLGALITSYEVIGAGYTPVRAIIDRAASLIPRPKWCFALVVAQHQVAGMFFATPEEAWKAAADLSAQKHIVYVDRPFQRVLAVMPLMYDDLWTAAKGMYKTEPVVADGGEVIIYAPHVTEVSYTHGRLIEEVGYHCRDFFQQQWEKYRHIPGGVLAHSTHVKGLGQYDAARGIETPRIQVTLASGIPEERCRRINLGYRDPKSIRIEDWKGREAEGMLLVPHAGEMLYRLRKTATAAS